MEYLGYGRLSNKFNFFCYSCKQLSHEGGLACYKDQEYNQIIYKQFCLNCYNPRVKQKRLNGNNTKKIH